MVNFTNIAGVAAGLAHTRTPSGHLPLLESFLNGTTEASPIFPGADLINFPFEPHGISGVAVLDFDNDGDDDIYVLNGPAACNKLFQNLLAETGKVEFQEISQQAGVCALGHDSLGVCYGDTDNDGNVDILVLGRGQDNLFLVNTGTGTFQESSTSGLGGGQQTSTSCSMGDIDGDGLLDVVIASSFAFETQAALRADPFAFNQANQLFQNKGGNQFEDVSASSGILSHGGVIGANLTITWATTMVDIDLDGDMDIIFADDQGPWPQAGEQFCVPPPPANPQFCLDGIDRGLLHVFANDGAGHFTDMPIDDATMQTPSGGWMGLSFGDLNCDGNLDFFVTNFGDYGVALATGGRVGRRDRDSKWLLGNGDGTFQDPGTGALDATPFGWGTSVMDYDCDGDPDILYHGGLLESIYAIMDNPGVILENHGCTGVFSADLDVMQTTDYSKRSVMGVAIGDFNKDGFPDFVTSSNFISDGLQWIGDVVPNFADLFPGGPFDDTAFFSTPFLGNPITGFYKDPDFAYLDGDLTVEINSGNENGSFTVKLFGTVDLVSGGKVNREGIGAVVFCTPANGSTTAYPVLGGSSYASQDSLAKICGLGMESVGTIDVFWPGGTRNRLYDVQSGENIKFPEIPCSYDGAWNSKGNFVSCVQQALTSLMQVGAISPKDKNRFQESQLRAYD